MTVKKIGLIVPVLKNFEGFTRLMASVDVPLFPLVIPNYEGNLGVSAGWNSGLRRAINLGLEAVIISNDDVELFSATIHHMLIGLWRYDMVTAYNTRDEKYEKLEYIDSPDYSCFAVKPKEFVDKFGYFDEQFSPAYFEDNDMHYRIQLAGGSDKKATAAPMFHAGSVTQNWGGVPHVNSEMFEANREYYIQKWGGVPGEETYLTPFNDPNKTIKDW